MSELHTANAAGQASSADNKGVPARHDSLFPMAYSWKVAAMMALIMVLLAMLGVAITTASRPLAPLYWISLVPVYGVICLATAWARERHAGTEQRRPLVLRQLWHWLGIGVALSLDFVIRGTGEESGLGAGLTAMLLLALGCFLAGVHFEWLFAFVGALLALALIVIMKADEYIWLIFLVGGLSALALFGLPRLFERRHPRKEMVASASH